MSMKKKYYKAETPLASSDKLEGVSLKIYMSATLHARLKDQSRLQGLPMSRLGAIAIDNELDQEQPFFYDTSLPETYEEYAYVSEAAKVLEYIVKFPHGIGRDHLCLSRFDFGIEERAVVLCALKELIEKDMVEEIIPTRTKFKFWMNEYRLIRAKDIQYKDQKPKRFRRAGPEGEVMKGKRRIQDKDVER